MKTVDLEAVKVFQMLDDLAWERFVKETVAYLDFVRLSNAEPLRIGDRIRVRLPCRFEVKK